MNWDAALPEDWARVETVDAHAAGEPLRVVVDGLPSLDGDTILDRRRDMQANHDDLRTALVLEPRGHADMYGAVLTDPVSVEGDVGVLFTHNDGYSTMCGHGIVALAVVLVETGMIDAAPPETTIGFDTPAGLVTATATVERDEGRDRVASVSFENVPSFVHALDETVDVPGYGSVSFDLAYGGAFYAYCDVEAFDLDLTPGDADELRRAGMAVKRAVADEIDLQHPKADDLEYVYGTIFRGPARGDDADTRNVCVFADGQIDRSPTGTGVSGRLAVQHARGALDVGDAFVVESILGTTFTGEVVASTTVGDRPAVVPRVTGTAHVTGRSEFVRDPADPLRDGFRVD
ncbi:proline racemase family protein [Halorubellus sp. PRR65]|uniref:proline racemase family protein n=1 Tax=Halorubellus sp. PRR65 TaxID=3098148 RepID=UPI002B261A71|nr:proline racemase family protein [Halorubellus sp. PRR65]